MQARIVLAGFLALASTGLAAQAPTEFATSTFRVSVDFVVRDKDGKLIPDLAAGDVEVFENGVRQQVEALRLVQRAAPEATAATPAAPGPRAATPTVALEGPEVMALLFDRVAAENRTLVRQAMLGYFQEHWRAGQRVGVFAIGQRLGIAQTFTTEQGAILAGIDRAMGWGATEQQAGDRDARAITDTRTALANVPAGGGSPTGAGGAAAMAERMRLELVLASYEKFAELDADQQGLETLKGLRALVSALSVVPGRKAIVFLTDSFRLAPRTESNFDALVHAANDAQVSVYSVDAAGLRVASANADIAGDLGRGGRVGYIADALGASRSRGLSLIANSTGGSVIQDSSDLARGLAKADEDLGAYYLLSYSPTNESFDGDFREITVKVRRPHGDLRARKGYLAVKTRAWDGPVLAFEAPALARLDKDPKASAFPLRIQALQSPVGAGQTAVAVLAEVRAGDLSLKSDEKTGEFTQDFTIVAIVRDDKGRVIRKLSEYYPLKGPIAQLETANQSRILFYKETELPPGRLTVEVIVYDNRKGSASVRTMALPVPTPAEGRLRAGSLMLVARAEAALPVPADGREGLLVSGGVQFYPNLGEPLPPGTEMTALFLRAQKAPGGPGVEATLDILREDRVLTSAKLGAVAADATGRADLLSRVPVAKLQPGKYDLRVTLRDGQDVVVRSTGLTIGP